MKILASLPIIGAMAILPGQASAIDDAVLIYQVQTGGNTATQEFVSIYNNGLAAIDITDWCITYSSASDASQTQLGCFRSSEANSRVMLGAHSTALIATNEFLQNHPSLQPDLVFPAGIAATGGHIKLINRDGVIMDTLGWGTATRPENTSAPASPAGKILERLVNEDDRLLDINNNSIDFSVVAFTSLANGNVYEESMPDLPTAEFTLKITELMPDAAGADTGKEYIEFYNSGDAPINLNDYMLQVSPNFSKNYDLPDVILQPKQYISLTDIQTGIILPNTSASVRLLSTEGTVISITQSYSGLEEQTAWAWHDSSWQKTFMQTPNAANIIMADKPCPEGETRNSETGYCISASTSNEESPTTPCLPGYERNTVTNRCRKLTVASILQACKLTQTRNPGTGRCHNIATQSKSVVCKINQQRNPTTNRCRNIAAASTAKNCPAGQERNPDTGRCRKIAKSKASMQNVKDIKSPMIVNSAKWWMAGVAAIGSAGYAIFEWRREILSFIGGLAPGLPKL